MITVLDIETSVDFESKNRVSSPFFGQQIVFVGTQSFIPKQYLEEKQIFFFHEEVDGFVLVVLHITDLCLIQ